MKFVYVSQHNFCEERKIESHPNESLVSKAKLDFIRQNRINASWYNFDVKCLEQLVVVDEINVNVCLHINSSF